MKESEIMEILIDWNFWRKEQNVRRERSEYVEKAIKFLESNMLISLIGIRRAGKSTIIRQIIKKLLEKGKYEKEDTLIINFEDKRLISPDLELLERIWNIYLQNLKPGKKPIVCLDEVHKVKDWEKWVRTFHELEKGKIIISGSTSHLLKGELATLLTGRHLDIFVYPLSFKEFLTFKELKIENKIDLISKKNEIIAFLKEYLEFGGFPEVVVSDSKDLKKEILQNYFEDIIAKDIVERYKIKKIEKLKLLAKFYLTNISSLITFNSLEKLLNINADTIESFSKYLEEVGMVFFLSLFHPSLKKQEKAPRKVFSIDTGLSNSIGFRISENFGKIMENCVAIELLRKSRQDKSLEVYYWKEYGKAEGKEVDFVIKEGIQIKQLIQVTYASDKIDIKERETDGLLKAYNLFKRDNPELIIITWDYEDVLKYNNLEIKCIPLWKWLLNI